MSDREGQLCELDFKGVNKIFPMQLLGCQRVLILDIMVVRVWMSLLNECNAAMVYKDDSDLRLICCV